MVAVLTTGFIFSFILLLRLSWSISRFSIFCISCTRVAKCVFYDVQLNSECC